MRYVIPQLTDGIEADVGRIVFCLKGRDSGRYYVLAKKEGCFSYIANGKLRKIETPKRKNPIHLHITQLRVPDEYLANGRLLLTNREIKYLLKQAEMLIAGVNDV